MIGLGRSLWDQRGSTDVAAAWGQIHTHTRWRHPSRQLGPEKGNCGSVASSKKLERADSAAT